MRTFQHAASDTDYGLCATRHNLPVVIAPGYLAECNVNHTFKCFRASWRNRALSRGERWRLLVARKGLPPMDFWRFLWAHAGVRALWYWPRPYLRVLLGL